MTGTQARGDAHSSWRRVEIRVKGHLEPRWSDWLDGLTLTCEDGGTTLIDGRVVDQSALFGVIERVRDLALPLVSVHVDPGDAPTHNLHVASNPNNPAPSPPRS